VSRRAGAEDDANARSIAALAFTCCPTRCSRTSRSIFVSNVSGIFVVMRKKSHAAISASTPPLNGYLQRACIKAGLAGLWFHDLRRSFITNARRRGVPESVVMKMSGHKTRAVFDRYNIVNGEDLRAAVKKIEAGIALDLGHVWDTAGKDEPQKV